MKTGTAVIGFVVAAGLGVALTTAYNSSKEGKTVTVKQETKTAPGAGPSAAAAGAPAAATDVYKVPVGGSPQKGSKDALVTIVEFSEFECPFCSRVTPTIKQIQETYGADVRVVFKHQPLPFHPSAMPAAQMAVAAAEQGKFWELHDKLFENQKALAGNIEQYAADVGVDVAKAKAFIESGKAAELIKADQDLGAKIGARGTPTFFINGVLLAGAQPFDNFKKVIDEELGKAKSKVASGTSKSALYDAIIANGRESAPPPPQQQAPPPATRQKVELSSTTASKGGKEPLVTIVEWSDFECPFCSRALPTIKQILEAYGDKVQIQFRHQPLPFHQKAMPAAKAAVAAQRQGKFWQLHDKLFENQRAIEPADLERYAKEIGLDVAKWQKDMASPDVEEQIKKDMADGTNYGARGTPTFFVNGVPVRGAMPFESFKGVIDKEMELAEKLIASGTKRSEVYKKIMDTEAGKAVAGAEPQQRPAPAAPTGPVDVKFGRAPVQGKPNAPIQIIVYSDFECPFCGRVNPTIEQVQKTYGDKVAVAFKHYPLPFHQNAEPAAVASLAAHKQGKFWEMHTKLFANQRGLTRDNFVAFAKELGLNVDKFQKDLDDPALKAWVKEDMAEGSKFGVNGTPASFINGRLVSGAQPFDAFKAIIDEELKKKS
jgi:protein-disulfide isomerase